MLGGLGVWEIGIILLIAIILFGPRQIPKLAKAAGETIRELRGASRAVAEEVKGMENDLRDTQREIRR